MPPPDHVVVLLHGIRTEAPWAEMVRQVLAAHAPGIRVFPFRYGYFDVFRFLSPVGTRRRPAEMVVRRLRVLKEEFPGVPLSVVAHSFGTYTIARILDDETDIRLHRLLLCGSIIPQDYRWDKVSDRIDEEVVNDCGARDVWPVLARAGTWGFGPSGTFGFGHPAVRDRFHDFRHSDFFDPDFVRRFWVPYLVDGEIVASEWEAARPTPPWWMSALRLVRLPVVALVLAVALVGWGLWRKPPPPPPLVALAPGFDLLRNLPPADAANPSTHYSLVVYGEEDTLRLDDLRARAYFAGGEGRRGARRVDRLPAPAQEAGLRAYFTEAGLPEDRWDDLLVRYLRSPGLLDAGLTGGRRFFVVRHRPGAPPDTLPLRVTPYPGAALKTLILELERP